MKRQFFFIQHPLAQGVNLKNLSKRPFLFFATKIDLIWAGRITEKPNIFYKCVPIWTRVDRYIFRNRNHTINTMQWLFQGHLIGNIACLPQGPRWAQSINEKLYYIPLNKVCLTTAMVIVWIKLLSLIKFFFALNANILALDWMILKLMPFKSPLIICCKDAKFTC